LTSTGHRVEPSLADFGGDETVTDAICDHLNAHRIGLTNDSLGNEQEEASEAGRYSLRVIALPGTDDRPPSERVRGSVH